MAGPDRPADWLHPKTSVCGVSFSCLDRRQAAQWVIDAALEGRGGYVCVTGAHGVVAAQDDCEFMDILNAAGMNTLDGQPVVWIARSRGYKVERVTGRELVWEILARDTDAAIRHVLFGATPNVTDRMIVRLKTKSPQLRVQAHNPPFTEMADRELDSVADRLRAPGPAIVWLGLSTPKQERLAVRLTKRFPNAPIVTIGAGFNYIAGIHPVAPRIVTMLGLEWLFRLACEPHRLYRRYAHVVPRFLFLVGKEFYAGMFSARFAP